MTTLPKKKQQQEQQKQQTSSYPDVVYALEPLLQFSIYLLQVLRWKDDLQRHSLVLVLLWTLLCYHYYLFVMAAPLWLIFNYDTKTKKNKVQTTPLTYERVTNELREIQIELDIVLPFFQDLFDWMKKKGKNLFHVSILLITWMSLISLFTLSGCIWFLGFLLLSWKSPMFKLARHACHRVMLIYQHRNHQSLQNATDIYVPIKSSSIASSDRYYCFTIIENQRWYPLKGWSNMLLSNDRPEWSDIYHQRVPSTDLFKLPPPTTRTKGHKEVKISWSWAAENWHVQGDGWEYGSWDWKSWGTNSLNKLTRRRHWIRTAVLTEEQVTEKKINIPMSRSNSLSTVTTSSSLSSESSLSSIDLIPSLSTQLHTKSNSTIMVINKNHSESLFSSDAIGFTY